MFGLVLFSLEQIKLRKDLNEELWSDKMAGEDEKRTFLGWKVHN